MIAVHFGAGNIGRGFVGSLLANAGYELVFADVNAELIQQLQQADEYTVHEVSSSTSSHRVSGFRAINSAEDPEGLAREIAGADLVTCAVGPNILKFIAPNILAGLRQRSSDAAPLVVMACENAIRATDTLRSVIEELAGDEWETLSARARFANTAVDRIVPGGGNLGLDVEVEPYFEWAIESAPFGDQRPEIPGVTWVEDLGPYIERKLFTVNTGHASTAYLGKRAGYETIAESLADASVAEQVLAILHETKAVLVATHGFDPDVQEDYISRILERFRNPALEDTVDRVGRQPLRKLSRHERFVEPAARLAEMGTEPTALLTGIAALLRFDVATDDESVRMQGALRDNNAIDFVHEVSGLESADALTEPFARVVERARSELSSRA